MEKYIENNRLVIEAAEGKRLTDGADLYVRKYESPVGVRENETIYEITEAEYEAIQAEQATAALEEMGMSEE